MADKENTFKVLEHLTDNSFNMELSKDKQWFTLYETFDYMYELVFTKKELHNFIKELTEIETKMIDK